MWKWIVVALAFLFSSFTWANYYKRGFRTCSNFEEAERSYREDPENVHSQALYAICLVLKGEDAEGLSRLYHLRDYKNNVYAAHFIALYIGSGGTLGSNIDKRHYNEALEAYFNVLALINFDPSYPHNGHRVYEFSIQMELNSYFAVPLIYLDKFKKGHYGTYIQKYMQSPNYEDEGEKLNSYPEYSPYTRDSLRRVIEHAGRCAALPQKNHFDPNYYKASIKSCRLLKDLAQDLLPMEEKRLSLLENCPDLTEEAKCPEYYALHAQANVMLEKNTKEIKSLFAPVLEARAAALALSQ